MMDKSNVMVLLPVLVCVVLSCVAVADDPVPAEPEAALEHVPGTTKGVIDAEHLDRPADALQLVGEDEHIMVPEPGPGTNWVFKDGELTASSSIGGDSMLTPTPYADFLMHVEFNVNDNGSPDHEKNGNSGVYIQQRYEVQITNAYGVSEEDFKPNLGGSIYRMKKPDHLVSKPAGQWQSYDIVFRAARFEGEEKTENARITVYHNGVLIHDDYEMKRKTGAGKKEGPDPLPIRLQGHANPVRFRNVWIKALDLE